MAERNPVFNTMRLPFAFSNGAAFLGNTRTQLFGSDQLGAIAPAANTWPGTFPVSFFDDLAAARAGQDPQQQQSGGAVVYDCKTGKCSDGSDARPLWIDKWLYCAGLGGKNDAVLFCDKNPPVTKNDGTTGPSPFGDYGTYGSKLLGLDSEKIIKQSGFVILAIVLIAIAIYAMVKN